MELLSKKELENELYYVSDEARAFMEEEVKNFNLPAKRLKCYSSYVSEYIVGDILMATVKLWSSFINKPTNESLRRRRVSRLSAS